MLRVNLSDGSTLRLDLEHPDDRAEWNDLSNKVAFQQSIRGAAIHRDGVAYAMPLPQKFSGSPHYQAELVWDHARDRLAAERISCFIDTVRIDLTVYLNGSPPMARVDIKKVGKRRHVPTGNEDVNRSSRRGDDRRRSKDPIEMAEMPALAVASAGVGR